MRILATIAHFFDAAGDAYYGSTGPEAAPRAAALTRAVTAFHQLCGPRQAKLLNRIRRVMVPTNRAEENRVDVVVCTTKGKHLLERLEIPDGMIEHVETDAEPLRLGFECHRVLARRLGEYDFYGYLEDDLVLQDPWFFAKLAWFAERAGDEALLQPNRFELSATEPVHKLYIDGHLSPDFAGRWQNVRERPRLTGQIMGRDIVFERPNNPHSGCFFLNARQMAAWADRPHFLDGDVSFAGPLESAATLGVIKTFRVYKPAAECADFLEILHANNRYLGNWLKL